jgi:hypothetical protein
MSRIEEQSNSWELIASTLYPDIWWVLGVPEHIFRKCAVKLGFYPGDDEWVWAKDWDYPLPITDESFHRWLKYMEFFKVRTPEQVEAFCKERNFNTQSLYPISKSGVFDELPKCESCDGDGQIMVDSNTSETCETCLGLSKICDPLSLIDYEESLLDLDIDIPDDPPEGDEEDE